MVWLKIDLQGVFTNILWFTLSILIFLIIYRLILRREKKKQINKEYYLFMHPIEKVPASGIVTVFIEVHTPKHIQLSVFNTEKTVEKIVAEQELKKGGNIIKFDTRQFENGTYFYQATAENQQSRKKMEIRN